jgi:hypothetical protein
MGISGGKKTTTTSKETVGPSAYAQPYIDAAGRTLGPAYEQSRSVMERYLPQVDSAAGYFGDVMGGKYLSGNPHLQGVIDSSNADITDSVNQAFMPRFGSGYHAKTLTRALGENEGRLRYGDYASERGYQDQAARAIPGVAATATALPMIPAQGYADATSGLLGRYMTSNGTQTQKQSGGLLSTILGSGLALASDIRLKTDIRKVGQTDGGLPVYTFRYGGEGPVHMGVMAQDVAMFQPEALGPEMEGGFKTVYYGEVR